MGHITLFDRASGHRPAGALSDSGLRRRGAAPAPVTTPTSTPTHRRPRPPASRPSVAAASVRRAWELIPIPALPLGRSRRRRRLRFRHGGAANGAPGRPDIRRQQRQLPRQCHLSPDLDWPAGGVPGPERPRGKPGRDRHGRQHLGNGLHAFNWSFHRRTSTRHSVVPSALRSPSPAKLPPGA